MIRCKRGTMACYQCVMLCSDAFTQGTQFRISIYLGRVYKVYICFPCWQEPKYCRPRSHIYSIPPGFWPPGSFARAFLSHAIASVMFSQVKSPILSISFLPSALDRLCNYLRPQKFLDRGPIPNCLNLASVVVRSWSYSTKLFAYEETRRYGCYAL